MGLKIGLGIKKGAFSKSLRDCISLHFGRTTPSPSPAALVCHAICVKVKSWPLHHHDGSLVLANLQGFVLRAGGGVLYLSRCFLEATGKHKFALSDSINVG